MSAVPQAIQPAQTLETLADAWAAAKHEEDDANRRRVEIEARIIAIAGEREEGSETHALADGRKLTVTAKITRTVDDEVWAQVINQVPEALRPIRYVQTAKIDLAGIRYLLEKEPRVYAIVAKAISAKRGKSSISLRAA